MSTRPPGVENNLDGTGALGCSVENQMTMNISKYRGVPLHILQTPPNAEGHPQTLRWVRRALPEKQHHFPMHLSSSSASCPGTGLLQGCTCPKLGLPMRISKSQTSEFLDFNSHFARLLLWLLVLEGVIILLDLLQGVFVTRAVAMDGLETRTLSICGLRYARRLRWPLFAATVTCTSTAHSNRPKQPSQCRSSSFVRPRMQEELCPFQTVLAITMTENSSGMNCAATLTFATSVIICCSYQDTAHISGEQLIPGNRD